MTCIAWDGITLAADRRRTCGNTISSGTKIFRVLDELIGGAGSASGIRELHDWYASGADPALFPEHAREDGDGASALVVIRADGTAWEYSGGPVPFQTEDKHAAWGCGAESALVAMACGLCAASAVVMVSRFNCGCGNGVDSLNLKLDGE